jgi:hypothetical protein
MNSKYIKECAVETRINLVLKRKWSLSVVLLHVEGSDAAEGEGDVAGGDAAFLISQ